MPLKKFLESFKGSSSRDIFSMVSDYTLSDKQRLGNLAALADYCNKAKMMVISSSAVLTKEDPRQFFRLIYSGDTFGSSIVFRECLKQQKLMVTQHGNG